VVEAARRAVGWVFAAVVLFFSTYPLFGDFMPGMLYAKRFAFDRLCLFHILGEDSVMGIPLHVFGRLFFGYMIFALGLQAFGIGRFFNEIAVAFLGKTRGGNAKVAIVASALFGSISGHPGANIFATGAFTIPAMKKEGFSPEFAGAVEATASTGGVIMPPIMGAVAFIMAEFIEISYATVCLAALVPSLLYYLCLFAQIDAYSARRNLKPSPIEISVPPIWRTIFDNFHIILGFAFLLYLLFYIRLEAWAPWFATGLTFVLACLTRRTRINLQDFARFLEDSGRTLGQMMGIMAPVGMIIGSLILAGIAYSMPYSVVKLAGDNRYLLLVFGAMASFVLGMGVSITACYIFLAIVLAPGLVMAKFDILASHMFVLYCGLWSFITPPVCLSAFTAAIIAGGNAMKTAFISMRLGIVTFFVPFFFVLKPAMIFRGPPLDTVYALATSIPGVILMSGAIEGYVWYLGKVGIVTRLLIFVSGFLMAIPESNTDLVGIAVAVIVIAVILIRKKIAPTRDARGN
jgi:TRAP transporter 4TM/12TM fusion protein